MKVEDKLHKLAMSVRKHLRTEGCIISNQYKDPNGCQKIQLQLILKGKSKSVTEDFNLNWTLDDWKNFRDRCVVGLMGL